MNFSNLFIAPTSSLPKPTSSNILNRSKLVKPMTSTSVTKPTTSKLPAAAAPAPQTKIAAPATKLASPTKVPAPSATVSKATTAAPASKSATAPAPVKSPVKPATASAAPKSPAKPVESKLVAPKASGLKAPSVSKLPQLSKDAPSNLKTTPLGVTPKSGIPVPKSGLAPPGSISNRVKQ